MKIKDVTPGFNVGEDDQKRSNRPQGKGPFKARSLYLILILLAAVYYYILLPPPFTMLRENFGSSLA